MTLRDHLFALRSSSDFGHYSIMLEISSILVSRNVLTKLNLVLPHHGCSGI